MRETGYSPIAQAEREVQQARWLLWQTASVSQESAPPEHPVTEPDPPQVQMVSVPTIQHRRYDAVVQRMQMAKKQSGAYSAWT